MQSLKIIFFIGSFWGIILNILSDPANGTVFDYNTSSKKVTVMTTMPASFLIGQTAYIVRDKKEIGQITIDRTYHTKFLGTLTSGDAIKKNDLVVLKLADATGIQSSKVNRESFKDKSGGRGWLVTFACEGAPKNTEVERKLNIGNIITFKKSGDNKFSQTETASVKSLHFRWSNDSLTGTFIILKKGNEKILTDEILSKNIFGRFKPDLSIRDKVEECKIILNTAKDVLENNPDGIPVNVKLKNAVQSLGRGEVYLLKVYSNSLFVTEFVIDMTKMENGKFSNIYYISPNDFYSGFEQLEFYIVEAGKVNDEFFEKGEQIKIGEKKIEYSEKTINSIEFSIQENNKRLTVN